MYFSKYFINLYFLQYQNLMIQLSIKSNNLKIRMKLLLVFFKMKLIFPFILSTIYAKDFQQDFSLILQRATPNALSDIKYFNICRIVTPQRKSKLQ
ncbi:hypothetical protein pb186bvf_008017 [Paramecium bursaria]